ncbi:V8-like Glu-specific endopeptidase [Amycolatopsis echigonensis]|uniref:V8-like Glu-specific endopeptidase n=1 Tax=Amycolatopsis echigonensis TaxID=2576905 RepID=A0A2N3WRT9_9PSEU|nr:trypsin-like peptidase domain-containing protein [Amycolatopsis niigatensis]PKV96604.1 V8-like Glu-specific endopeptidase [Amycolatopsis niigatensis]
MRVNVSRTALVVCAAAAIVATGGANAVVDTADVAGAASQPSGTGTPAVSTGGDSRSTGTTNSSSTPTTGTTSPTVGALFSGGNHFCSASVVHSPTGDLLLTAAHCVSGDVSGITFKPGYHDGIAPYGTWQVTAATVADGWKSSSDQDLDFAFLKVAQPGSASLESITGANQLGTNQGFSHTITLTGYPDGTEQPVVCTGVTTQSDTYQQRVACPGFPDGTSGGPWVINQDPNTGTGTVIGTIGGYQTGGDTPDVSYSAYFDDDITQLYNSAIS